MRVIEVPGLGCRALIVECDDETLLLIDADLGIEERIAVMGSVMAET